MKQPTPITVTHVPGPVPGTGITTYHVNGFDFATPRKAHLAAEAIDRGIAFAPASRTAADLTSRRVLGDSAGEPGRPSSGTPAHGALQVQAAASHPPRGHASRVHGGPSVERR